MYQVDVIDRKKGIIKIEWIGNVSVEDIQKANTDIEQAVKQLNPDQFDVMVNMRGVKVFVQDAQKELVKHQQWLLDIGMNRAAVIVEGSIAKMQLNRTAKESNHNNEFHFESDDDALSFLQAN
ncbi:STAS/SEC14 domain-containing protein [Alkalibacillus almallahensis]|uniref:STAS/SEC14 domain-containing protein n=1 Tax=Alkalibacillus almallahensis TaxID=1379154 RepID=UPI001422A468|nr:STAS/SEC14 domain-containing protein [Alkalibacillus almallahensis]NIK11431.1 sarcosine oxidase gamma subunit [Alkalibacillus almallahensis]